MQSIAGWFCSSFLRRSLCQGCGDPWGSFDHSKPREGDQEDQQQHGGIGQVVCRFSQNRNWLDSRQDRSLEKNPTFHPTQPFCLGKKTDNAFFMNDFLWQLLKPLRFIFFLAVFFLHLHAISPGLCKYSEHCIFERDSYHVAEQVNFAGRRDPGSQWHDVEGAGRICGGEDLLP